MLKDGRTNGGTSALLELLSQLKSVYRHLTDVFFLKNKCLQTSNQYSLMYGKVKITSPKNGDESILNIKRTSPEKMKMTYAKI